MQTSRHVRRGRQRSLFPCLVLAVLGLVGVVLAVLGINTYLKNKQYQEYLQTLEGSAFNKYLNNPPSYSDMVHTAAWDVYFFKSEDFQCVQRGDYNLFVHKGGEADKTVLWLQAGGECWPGHACGGTSPATVDAFDKLLTELNQTPFGPVMPDAQNPLAAWNYIFVPSCDGSFHFGDSEADYDGDGNIDHYHNGLRQSTAAITLMKKFFPDSQKILIAGNSTGGYGTFGITPVVRLAYPDANLYVLNDSGPGIFSSKEPAIWPLMIKTWNLDPLLPQDCTQCHEQLIYLYNWLLARDSKLKIGLFSSYQDATVSPEMGMSGAENEARLRELTGQIHQDHADTFKRFLIKGDSHTITNYNLSVDGVSIWNWVGYLVNDDSKWADLSEK